MKTRLLALSEDGMGERECQQDGRIDRQTQREIARKMLVAQPDHFKRPFNSLKVAHWGFVNYAQASLCVKCNYQQSLKQLGNCLQSHLQTKPLLGISLSFEINAHSCGNTDSICVIRPCSLPFCHCSKLSCKLVSCISARCSLQ